MPTVPTINRQVQTQSIQAPGLQYQSFNAGAPAAQAAGQVANVAFDIAMKQKQDADRVAVQAAINRIDQFETGLYDPNGGIYSKKGRDAIGLPDQVSEQYQQLAGQLQSTLSNDTQRAMFDEIRQQRQNQIINSVQRYSMREYDSYADQQEVATIQLAQQLAVDNYQDPARVDSEIQKAFTAVLSRAERLGLPPEQVRLQAQQAVSAIHVGVIGRMAEDAPLASKAYFEANKDELFGEDEARAEQIVTTKAKAYEADEVAEGIVVAGGDKISEWLKQADSIDDPELKSMVRDRLKVRFNDMEIAKQEAIAEQYKLIRDNQIDPRKQDWWGSVNEPDRSNMISLYRQVRQGEQPVTDEALLLELRAMDQKQLAQVSEAQMLAYRTKLDDQAYSYVSRKWETAIAASKSPEKAMEFAGYQSTEQRIRNAATLSGFINDDEKPSDLKGDNLKRYMQFNDSLELRLQAESFERGRKLTAAEEQAIIDEAVYDMVYLRKGFFSADTQVPMGAVIQGDRPYIPLSEIPDTDKVKYRQYIENQGWSDGDVNRRIEEAYPYLLQGNMQAAMMILRGNN